MPSTRSPARATRRARAWSSVAPALTSTDDDITFLSGALTGVLSALGRSNQAAPGAGGR
ncbi:hypothetical protein ACIRO3_29795 [Streptomyces sp. NPDC102278]|uniref:hypothetical protein n=1 Tax=Streptomyces sp. NPDC102278 TaxID=3366152 RepID=UPI003817586E